MNKVITLNQAMDYIQDGMTVMIGGFMGVGTPEHIIDAMVKKGIKDLTLFIIFTLHSLPLHFYI